jgi:putative transposase
LDRSVEEKRRLIEPGHQQLSLTRQCQLIGLSRASLYYQPRGESGQNLHLMRLLDEQYTRTPFYGVPKMTAWLRGEGYPVNEKRVRRLLRLMGLEAIYQRPKLSEPAPGHRIYPYLLRGVPVLKPNHVWSTDITYIRMFHGFIYLVAIIDWFSRYVVSWEISVTLDSEFCLSALDRALAFGRPEILDTGENWR